MKKLLAGICLFFSLSVNALGMDQTTWRPEWSFDPMTDKVSCLAFSSLISFSGKITPNHAYIGIQDNGIVTLQTSDAFDPRFVEKFGIRPGQQPAIMKPEAISTSTAAFSESQSKQIIEGLIKEGEFTMQVAFFLENKPVQRTLKTGVDMEAFKIAFASKNYCNLIKENQGWVGIAMYDMTEVAEWMSLITKQGYEKPGVTVWSVHPKKAAAKIGIKTFDVILEANDKPVNMKSMLDIFTLAKPGDSIGLTIFRSGNIEKLTLIRP